MHAYIYISVRIYFDQCVQECLRAEASGLCVSVCVYRVCENICFCAYVCMCVFVSVFMFRCVFFGIYLCVFVSVHTYM